MAVLLARKYEGEVRIPDSKKASWRLVSLAGGNAGSSHALRDDYQFCLSCPGPGATPEERPAGGNTWLTAEMSTDMKEQIRKVSQAAGVRESLYCCGHCPSMRFLEFMVQAYWSCIKLNTSKSHTDMISTYTQVGTVMRESTRECMRP